MIVMLVNDWNGGRFESGGLDGREEWGGVVGWLDRSGGWSGVAGWPKGREGQLAWFTLHINVMIQLIK